MSPSYLVKDLDATDESRAYIAFCESSALLNFLTSEKKSGVDIDAKYFVYTFSVEGFFEASEAIDTLCKNGTLFEE